MTTLYSCGNCGGPATQVPCSRSHSVSPEPSMDEKRLAEIEARHEVLLPHAGELGMQSITADLGALLTEVRRLRRENHLLNLSRGVPSIVGGD